MGESQIGMGIEKGKLYTALEGLKFYGMVEKLRTALHKKVDVLSLEQLKDNLELTDEILKNGIRIYPGTSGGFKQ